MKCETSCFCRAELNSGIKLDKSTAEARRLNQTLNYVRQAIKFDKLCGPTRLWNDSDSNRRRASVAPNLNPESIFTSEQ